MNHITPLSDAKRHSSKRNEDATTTGCSHTAGELQNEDYGHLHSYLDALGVSQEERARISELAAAQRGKLDTNENSMTAVVWLSRVVPALLDSQPTVETGSGEASDTTTAFLEWRLRSRLSRYSGLLSESLGTHSGEPALKPITLAPAIVRTPMPTARFEHNYVRLAVQFSVERLSTLRVRAVQAYRRLLIGV